MKPLFGEETGIGQRDVDWIHDSNRDEHCSPLPCRRGLRQVVALGSAADRQTEKGCWKKNREPGGRESVEG